MRILAQLPVLLVLAASPALAGDFYSYEQDNGTLAFSDEYAKVPARYRPQVEKRSSQGLRAYPRHTEVQRYPNLRGSNPEGVGELQNPTLVFENAQPTMLVNAGQGLQVPVAIGMGEDAPKVEVRYAYRWVNGRYTPFTIVRQGDRVLAEIERPGGN
jgi:hypothetical protein